MRKKQDHREKTKTARMPNVKSDSSGYRQRSASSGPQHRCTSSRAGNSKQILQRPKAGYTMYEDVLNPEKSSIVDSNKPPIHRTDQQVRSDHRPDRLAQEEIFQPELEVTTQVQVQSDLSQLEADSGVLVMSASPSCAGSTKSGKMQSQEFGTPFNKRLVSSTPDPESLLEAELSERCETLGSADGPQMIPERDVNHQQPSKLSSALNSVAVSLNERLKLQKQMYRENQQKMQQQHKQQVGKHVQWQQQHLDILSKHGNGLMLQHLNKESGILKNQSKKQAVPNVGVANCEMSARAVPRVELSSYQTMVSARHVPTSDNENNTVCSLHEYVSNSVTHHTASSVTSPAKLEWLASTVDINMAENGRSMSSVETPQQSCRDNTNQFYQISEGLLLDTSGNNSFDSGIYYSLPVKTSIANSLKTIFSSSETVVRSSGPEEAKTSVFSSQSTPEVKPSDPFFRGDHSLHKRDNMTTNNRTGPFGQCKIDLGTKDKVCGQVSSLSAERGSESAFHKPDTNPLNCNLLMTILNTPVHSVREMKQSELNSVDPVQFYSNKVMSTKIENSTASESYLSSKENSEVKLPNLNTKSLNLDQGMKNIGTSSMLSQIDVEISVIKNTASSHQADDDSTSVKPEKFDIFKTASMLSDVPGLSVPSGEDLDVTTDTCDMEVTNVLGLDMCGIGDEHGSTVSSLSQYSICDSEAEAIRGASSSNTTTDLSRVIELLKVDTLSKNNDKQLKHDTMDQIKDETRIQMKDDTMNQVRDDIKNQRTDDIKNQRTDDIKNQRTDDIKNQRTDDIKNQKTDDIKNQRTDDIKKQRTDDIKNQRTDDIKNQRTDDIKKQKIDDTKNNVKDKTKNLVKDETKNQKKGDSKTHVKDGCKERNHTRNQIKEDLHCKDHIHQTRKLHDDEVLAELMKQYLPDMGKDGVKGVSGCDDQLLVPKEIEHKETNGNSTRESVEVDVNQNHFEDHLDDSRTSEGLNNLYYLEKMADPKLKDIACRLALKATALRDVEVRDLIDDLIFYADAALGREDARLRSSEKFFIEENNKLKKRLQIFQEQLEGTEKKDRMGGYSDNDVLHLARKVMYLEQEKEKLDTQVTSLLQEKAKWLITQQDLVKANSLKDREILKLEEKHHKEKKVLLQSLEQATHNSQGVHQKLSEADRQVSHLEQSIKARNADITAIKDKLRDTEARLSECQRNTQLKDQQLVRLQDIVDALKIGVEHVLQAYESCPSREDRLTQDRQKQGIDNLRRVVHPELFRAPQREDTRGHQVSVSGNDHRDARSWRREPYQRCHSLEDSFRGTDRYHRGHRPETESDTQFQRLTAQTLEEHNRLHSPFDKTLWRSLDDGRQVTELPERDPYYSDSEIEVNGHGRRRSSHRYSTRHFVNVQRHPQRQSEASRNIENMRNSQGTQGSNTVPKDFGGRTESVVDPFSDGTLFSTLKSATLSGNQPGNDRSFHRSAPHYTSEIADARQGARHFVSRINSLPQRRNPPEINSFPRTQHAKTLTASGPVEHRKLDRDHGRTHHQSTDSNLALIDRSLPAHDTNVTDRDFTSTEDLTTRHHVGTGPRSSFDHGGFEEGQDSFSRHYYHIDSSNLHDPATRVSHDLPGSPRREDHGRGSVAPVSPRQPGRSYKEGVQPLITRNHPPHTQTKEATCSRSSLATQSTTANLSDISVSRRATMDSNNITQRDFFQGTELSLSLSTIFEADGPSSNSNVLTSLEENPFSSGIAALDEKIANLQRKIEKTKAMFS